MNFKFGELFCGPGGLGLSAHRTVVKDSKTTYTISTVWANDYDKDTCQTYQENILNKNRNNARIICKDIRKLNIENLPYIDSLAFGFPCNDFSIVGERKGMNGVYGPLYSYGVKTLKHFQPIWFLAENVGGLRNSNEGSAFKMILNELYNSGYDIFPHTYKFELYGVPQSRHRIIIVGFRKDMDINFQIPAPTYEIPINCQYAIENPPISKDAPNNELTKQSAQVIERLKYIKPGENAFTADLPSHLRLNINGARISQIYKRLDPNKPSYTVTGSGGGGTHVYHWKENRALTNRERARLQSFPDDFIFYGSKESVRKQIGMAVPPVGADAVFKAILNTMAGLKYPSVESNMKEFIITHKNNRKYCFQQNGQLKLLETKTEYNR